MKVATYDTTRYRDMVQTLEFILEHRQHRPTTRCDELYYDMLVDYFRQPLRAVDGGKPLVAHTAYIPSEIFTAMDLVPLHLESFSIISPTVLRNFEEMASVAKGFGLTPEVCSAHRVQAAWFVQGWLPRPQAVVWSQQLCDSINHSGSLLKEAYDVPGYFLDRPYYLGEREVQYYTRNLAEMVEFLEITTGHHLDQDRLCQALAHTHQIAQAQREMYALCRQVPCPMPNRLGDQIFSLCNWLYLGTQQGVDFAHLALEEVRERVGKGVVPQENLRLISLYPPPAFHWKLLDWMEREFGAVIVARPYCLNWASWEPDYSNPLESLARRCFAIPISRHFHAPLMDAMVPDAVNDAISHHAEGAIYFAMINCRQGCAMVRPVKDALLEQAGIPTVVVDVDTLDPSFTSEDDIKDKLESFFEVLAERKENVL